MFNQILVNEVPTQTDKNSRNYGGGNTQSEKGMVHFRRKKKEILDQILDAIQYDRQIRPAGHVNDTSGCCYILLDSSPLVVMNVCTTNKNIDTNKKRSLMFMGNQHCNTYNLL